MTTDTVGKFCSSFTVHDVSPVRAERYTVPLHTLVSELINTQVEASSHRNIDVAFECGRNGLVDAVLEAYDYHRELVFTPDVIWMTLLQGLSSHISRNAEMLRSKFVTHEGQLALRVDCDSFVLGSPTNDWPGVFSEFSTQIQENLVDNVRTRFLPLFSTTGPTEHAAFEVGLMDAMQSYFKYEVFTACGIPRIHLAGTADDWCEIQDRFCDFAKFGLQWWVDMLHPVLYEFFAAARGHVNTEFWQQMVHLPLSGSGGTRINGWILKLFPYIGDKQYTGGARLLGDIPSGMSSVPFVWHYCGKPYDYCFYAGSMGSVRDEEQRVSTFLSWYVAPAPAK